MGREYYPLVEMKDECSEMSINEVKNWAYPSEKAYCASCPLKMDKNNKHVEAYTFDSDVESVNSKGSGESSLQEIFNKIKDSEGIPNNLLYLNKENKCFCLVETGVTPGDQTPEFVPQ